MPATALGTVQSIAAALGSSAGANAPPLSEVVLVGLDDAGDLPTDPTEREFFRLQYFPESVSSTKAVNWSPTEIPGGSLPLYQWVASGEHQLTFTAQFTCDVDLIREPDLAKELFQNNTQRNVDIRSAVAALRRYTLPSYRQAQAGTQTITLTKPPRRLRLFIPNSGIGLLSGEVSDGGGIMYDSVVMVMTQCDVTLKHFHNSGLPQSAEVSLGFAQIAQFAGAIKFPSAGFKMRQAATTGEGTPFFGYKLKPRYINPDNPSDLRDNLNGVGISRATLRAQSSPGSF